MKYNDSKVIFHANQFSYKYGLMILIHCFRLMFLLLQGLMLLKLQVLFLILSTSLRNILILITKIHFPPKIKCLTTPLEIRDWSENLSDVVSHLNTIYTFLIFELNDVLINQIFCSFSKQTAGR